MKRIALLLLLALALAVTTVTAATPDISGKWSGSFRVTTPSGETEDDTSTCVLKQEGNKITGTGGPSDDKQWPITKGTIDGDNIYIEVTADDGPVWKVTLKFADGHLKGEAWAEVEGKKVGGPMDLTKQ